MMNKKFTGILIAISILASFLIMPISGQAAIGIENEAQVSKLNAFGILSGYPDAGYKADTKVSARDFTDAAYRLAGINIPPYSVLTDKFGVNFNDASMTVQNAAAVLLTALNYDTEAEAKGGYPKGYTDTALSYGIFDGIAPQMTDGVTNNIMAVMLYNALELDHIQMDYNGGIYNNAIHTNKTVLENLKIYDGKGLITGTQYASLDGYARADAGEIIIDGEDSYSLGRTYADTLLGYSVEFYYNDDYELIWLEPRDITRVSRVAEVDVISFGSGEMTFYDENEKKRTQRFDDPTFIRNNSPVYEPTAEDFVPTSGYITLVDGDGDGKAELVSCESYEYFLVSAKNSANESINDYETNKVLSLNQNDYGGLEIIKNGQAISFADISENDILAVMRADDPQSAAAKVIVSPYAPISGTVTSTSFGKVKIDGAAYDISTAYEGTALSSKKSGTFYLDINGNIVRFVKGANTTSKYAYLISAYRDEGGEVVYAKILTAGSTIEEHELNKKVRFNNDMADAEEIFSRMGVGVSIEKQLITYELNAEGKITKINSANKNNLYTGNDDPTDYFSLYSQGHARYRQNNMSFNSKYLIESTTPIFIVPASRNQKDYSVKTASALTNGTSYYASIYDIDEFMIAGAVVIDEVSSDPQTLTSLRSILVEDIEYGTNADGDDVFILEGYQQGSKISLSTKDDTPIKDSEGRNYSIGDLSGYKRLDTGDVIQASLDSDGNLLAFRTLYRADEPLKKLVIASYSTPNEYEEGGNVNEFANLFILHGEVTSRSSNILVVESDTKRAHKITNGASVYLVENGKIEKVTTNDIYTYDEVYLHTYQGNMQEVVIYR